MAQGNWAGYIYGIVDPATEEIVFIGSSLRPWDNIYRHIADNGGNEELSRWIRSTFYGKRIEVLQEEVIDKYLGERRALPPVKDGCVRLNWIILGIEPYTEDSSKAIKTQIVRSYKEQGQAWFNRSRGRKVGYTKQVLEIMRREREILKQEQEQKALQALNI